MTLAKKLSVVTEELKRKGNSPSDKVLRIAQRGMLSVGLSPRVNLARCVIVELVKAPEIGRGLSDLDVRRAGPDDIPGLCAVVGAEDSLFRARLGRGDLGFVGAIDGEILCYTWFHPGPTSFEEDSTIFAPWAVEESAFWSYDAMTRPDARTSGVFVKVFKTALRDLFAVHGARRVQGFIHHTNEMSLTVHQRLGFATVGSVTALALPGVKWLHWENRGKSHQRLLSRDSDFALRFSSA